MKPWIMCNPIAIAALATLLSCQPSNSMPDVDYTKYYSEKKEVELIRAVMEGDKSTIRRLAAEGVDLNAVGQYENTPMRVAIKTRQKPIVQFLLQLGVDPNYKTSKGAVAADDAIIEKDPDYLALLLEHGLDPNLKSDNVPLVFYAISEGNWRQYDMLLGCGADINSRNADDSTLLLDLVLQLEYDRAKQLLLKGADFKATSKAGLTVAGNLIECQKKFCMEQDLPDCKKRAELLRLMQQRGLELPPDVPGV